MTGKVVKLPLWKPYSPEGGAKVTVFVFVFLELIFAFVTCPKCYA
jgi:hypothetical protein